MKFRCDRDALSEALQTVQRGVSSRPGIPALTGVLLDATDAGQLTLTTTDLEVSARLTIDVQVTEAGTALVPARLLGDTVKSLSDLKSAIEKAVRAVRDGKVCVVDIRVVPGYDTNMSGAPAAAAKRQ